MKIRSLIDSSLGNILECHDFQLFAIFSPILGKIFFPGSSPSARMLETLMVFAIGFLCRPVGSLLFGYRGDRKGRASTLRLSICLAALPTLLIAFLPTWSQAGILAPILLTVLRMCQGISLGGAYSGNMLWLAESAPRKHRALVTSFACVGANMGILLALGVGLLCATLLPDHLMQSWGWRIPWLISGVVSLTICFTRLNFQETVSFKQMINENRIEKNPVATAFKKNVPDMLRTIGLVCSGTAFYYLIYIWLPVYLENELHFSIIFVSSLMACLLIVSLFLIPLAGFICDQVKRKKMLLFNALAIAVIVIPCLHLLQPGHVISVVIVLSILIMLSCLEQAATAAAVVENFPMPARYTGFSLGYNIGNGLIGGTAPLICTWLTQKFPHSSAAAFYIAGCALVTAGVIRFFLMHKDHIYHSSTSTYAVYPPMTE